MIWLLALLGLHRRDHRPRALLLPAPPREPNLDDRAAIASFARHGVHLHIIGVRCLRCEPRAGPQT